MNKLVLLSEIRKGRDKDKDKDKDKLLELDKIKSVQGGPNKSYVTFKEKFNFFQNKEGFIQLNSRRNNNTKYEKRLNEVLKLIFLLDNKKLLIDFFNSIYNDDLSANTRIEYIKNKDINNQVINLKNSSQNVRILAEDDYKKFEYEIQFQTIDDQNMAISITKIDFAEDYINVISLSKKKKEREENSIVNNLEKSSKDNYNRCLIMLNSNIDVPDVYEFKSNFGEKNIDCKINIIKSWKYDFKQLFEKNMYLLFPIKVLDIRKRLLSISQEIVSKELIKDEIVRFFKDMNRYLMKIKDKNLITDKDINELNLISINLLNNFIKEESNAFVNIKRDIEATLKDIVV